MSSMNAELPADLDRWILAQRPARNAIDPWRPYATLVEPADEFRLWLLWRLAQARQR